MKITQHVPEPAPVPPTTYTLEGLTQEEVDDIRQSLFHRACNDSNSGVRGRYRKLHAALYLGQYGFRYASPGEFDRTYTPYGSGDRAS